jgi:hypothetical protein
MIKIAETGNTVIEIATTGVEVEGGTQWTVYPDKVDDPTFQKFTPEQQNRVKELSITGFRGKEDLGGHEMNKELAKAIAMLQRNLSLEQYKNLGLVADRIDVDPEGEVARVLETEYGIKSIEKEGQTSIETKQKASIL